MSTPITFSRLLEVLFVSLARPYLSKPRYTRVQFLTFSLQGRRVIHINTKFYIYLY